MTGSVSCRLKPHTVSLMSTQIGPGSAECAPHMSGTQVAGSVSYNP